MWMEQTKTKSFTRKFWIVQILVFRTDLSSAEKIETVRPKLDIIADEWNVDLHDCDYVLRIVTENISGLPVIKTLSLAGFFCEELL